jgi:5-methyltetrahydropteroyltriglutamate--homocysteine methyltransferase
MTAVEIDTITRCRVDLVGSLLRPPDLIQAFADADAGKLDTNGLRQMQDQAIRAVIAEQESHGLPLITDGEFRRRFFQEGFGDVTGFAHGQLAPIMLPKLTTTGASGQLTGGFEKFAMVDRLRLIFNRPLEEFVFARALTDRVVKASTMTPNRVIEIFDPGNSTAVYPDVDAFVADVIEVQRQIITQLVRAGCQYIHIDAPGYAAYVDEPTREMMRERGDDPDALLEAAIEVDNAVIAGFDDVTFGLHVCRGNYKGQWARQGAYDPIAEKLYQGLNHDRLLLEYDDLRSGSFESLRFVPPQKVAVLGLLSTKVADLESVDELRRRIDEASRFLPLDQLALSPACGFSSHREGHPLSPDDQWRKIDRVLEVADQVWS